MKKILITLTVLFAVIDIMAQEQLLQTMEKMFLQLSFYLTQVGSGIPLLILTTIIRIYILVNMASRQFQKKTTLPI